MPLVQQSKVLQQNKSDQWIEIVGSLKFNSHLPDTGKEKNGNFPLFFLYFFEI